MKQSEIDHPFATLVPRRGQPQRLSGPSSSFVCLRGFLFFFVFFRLFQASRAPALPCRSSESETIRNRPIPLRSWYPVAVHLNALVALRRPSCLFVDSSFSVVFFRLFQASGAPALSGRSSESETIRNRPIPLRPWYPVTVNLNALVALRRSSWPFVDSSFSFVFFRLFQTSEAPAPRDGADHPSGKQIVFQENYLQVSWFQLVPRSEAAWAPGLFQARQAEPLPCRADHPRVKQSEIDQSLCDLGIPSRFTSTPWWPFVVLRVSSWIPLFLLSFFGCFRQAAPLPCRADHPRVKQSEIDQSLRDLGIPLRFTSTP